MSSDSDEGVTLPKKSKSSRRRGFAYKLSSNQSLTKPISSSSAVYSTCVSKCFSNIKSHSFKEDVKRVLMDSTNDDVEDDIATVCTTTKQNKKQTRAKQTTKPVLQKTDTLLISDDEDEDENSQNKQNTPTDSRNTSAIECLQSPSPPPPPEISAQSRRRRGGKQKKNLLSAANELSKNLSDAQSQLKETDMVMPESEVYVLDDDDDSLTIRVDILGSIQRYKLASDEVFSSLFGRIAAQQRVPEKHLMLVHKDRTLRPTETPQSVKLTTADIIKCHIITDDSLNESVTFDKDDDVIELVLQTRGSKHKEIIKTPRDKPLMIMMKEYANKIGTDLSGLQFWFDGEIVSQRETPEDLDMDDGDIIDVNITGVTVIN